MEQTLYMTFANEEEAKQISRELVTKRLVACVNILAPIQSLYWWNDSVQEDTEIACLAKTVSQNVEEVIQTVQKMHSYECPCIISLPIENGAPEYLKWIRDETKKTALKQA